MASCLHWSHTSDPHSLEKAPGIHYDRISLTPMAKETILAPEVLQQIEETKEADILIGIPSFNNSRTIGNVIRTVRTGLAKHFSKQRALIVTSDGGSQDETSDVIREAFIEDPRLIMLSRSPHPVHKMIAPYYGIPDKAGVFRTLFEIAENLGVKACAFVDADLKSITPEWVELLIKPILQEGFDYVTPSYLRHKYDGTITTSMIYPLTRALYGQRISQPIGGDFGFSGGLASHYLSKEVWHTEVARYGIDLWMTTTAITERFKICQSFLGAKVHEPRSPASDLSAMLSQVVGAAFSLMESYEHFWFSVKGSEPTPIYGRRFEVGIEPISVNLDRMINAYRQGVADLFGIWEHFVPGDTLAGLRRLASVSPPNFHFPDALWARTVYDFAVAHFRNKMDRDHLVKSMTPLYLGRTASFVIETQDSSAADVENKMELICLEYENLKPYLINRWKSY